MENDGDGWREVTGRRKTLNDEVCEERQIALLGFAVGCSLR
jgi:hypothetical protein